MLEKVIENWTSRLDYARASRNSPMPEILFKIRRASNPLVWLVEKEVRWEAPAHPQGFLPLNWGETEVSVTCMVLKATTNDRRHLAFCHDEFRGP
ncbi:uncharacterized protein TNCV_3499101 [Trichonephila clavipes]|nr:uncharacterized protein TNCV_3499101 [Trichonephila clavipes]